ncbi:hypothetical protein C8J57DRAFT_1641067, partial [Mycena rebaudengoi]
MWPFSRSPYAQVQRAVNELESDYDFIVVGGGTAGCVLARRLSEGGKHTVLLVEKGDAADSWLHRTPLTSLHHWSDGKHSTVFNSAPDARFGGRAFELITGMGLGGSTRINGGQYTCGAPAEYNAWGGWWAYQDFKKYLFKSETWVGPVPQAWHGSNGKSSPLTVRAFEDYQYGSSEKAASAATRLGFLPILDMHSPLEPSIGWNKMQFALGRDGSRQSAFRAYLPARIIASLARHLHICTRAVGGRVIFSRGDSKLRAKALEVYSVDGHHVRVVQARCEIVLTCGALATPQLLMLSGVGPEEHLQQMGIEVIRHTPGVGTHLQDHVYVPTSYNCPLSDSMWALIRSPLTLLAQLYKYLRYGAGWFLCMAVEVEIFGMSSLIDAYGTPAPATTQTKDPFDPNNIPDFAVMTCAIADPRHPTADRSRGFLGLNCALMHAESHGTVRLRSTDHFQPPHCEMRYLSAPADRAALRASLRVATALAREMRTAGYPLDPLNVPRTALDTGHEHRGKNENNDNDHADDATLDAFCDANLQTMYHYASSCRMALEETDADVSEGFPGVVDSALRVHGISNLRIADASVFPCVPAGHPQALVYGLAEKCADIILHS